MRVLLAAAAIGLLLNGPAFAQQDDQVPPPPTDGALGNMGDSPNGQIGDSADASDTFPDSTRIPEPSESGPPPADPADDGTQPH
jgi:hypothetical protein